MSGIGISISPIGVGGSGDIGGVPPTQLIQPTLGSAGPSGPNSVNAFWTDNLPIPLGIRARLLNASDSSVVSQQLISSGVQNVDFFGIASGTYYVSLINEAPNSSYISSPPENSGTFPLA